MVNNHMIKKQLSRSIAIIIVLLVAIIAVGAAFGHCGDHSEVRQS